MMSELQFRCPLQLVIMDILIVEEHLWGFKDLLVIVDHFTNFAVAVTTQTKRWRQLRWHW